MDAVRLARLTTPLAIAVVGLAAGHLIAPYAAGAPLARRVAFWGVMLAVGAWRGWREGAALEEPPARWRRRSALYAALSAALALAAYWLVHGPPKVP